MALLTPMWVSGEWIEATQLGIGSEKFLAAGLLLLAVSYLTALLPEKESPVRKTLAWIGGLALIPCTLVRGLLGRLRSRGAGPDGAGLPDVRMVGGPGDPVAAGVVAAPRDCLDEPRRSALGGGAGELVPSQVSAALKVCSTMPGVNWDRMGCAPWVPSG